jgi:hypothetical protein
VKKKAIRMDVVAKPAVKQLSNTAAVDGGNLKEHKDVAGQQFRMD